VRIPPKLSTGMAPKGTNQAQGDDCQVGGRVELRRQIQKGFVPNWPMQRHVNKRGGRANLLIVSIAGHLPRDEPRPTRARDSHGPPWLCHNVREIDRKIAEPRVNAQPKRHLVTPAVHYLGLMNGDITALVRSEQRWAQAVKGPPLLLPLSFPGQGPIHSRSGQHTCSFHSAPLSINRGARSSTLGRRTLGGRRGPGDRPRNVFVLLRWVLN
jgi:hypothetical protein